MCEPEPVTESKPDKQAIEEKVRQIVAARVNRNAHDIPTEKTFEELGFESIDALDIMFALEDEFGVTIPDETAQSVNTVKALAAIIAEAPENT